MEPKSRSTFEGNSTFSSSVIVQMESLENKQFHFLDVTCSLMGKISATTKLTKLLPIRRLLAGKQFIVTCHVINDSARLWRKISLPNRRLLAGKEFHYSMSHDPEVSNKNLRCKGRNNSYKGIYLLSGLREWWMTSPARHLQLLPRLPQRRLS